MIVLLFTILPQQIERLGWRAYYGSMIKQHRAELEAFASESHIAEIDTDRSLQRWRVIGFAQAKSRLMLTGIAKYSLDHEGSDTIRIVSWYDRDGQIVRYIVIQKEGNHLHPEESVVLNIKVPLGTQEFHSVLASNGFRQIWGASLLDVERERVGVYLDTQWNPAFYYEVKIKPTLWFYWETDFEGNILTYGIHDS